MKDYEEKENRKDQSLNDVIKEAETEKDKRNEQDPKKESFKIPRIDHDSWNDYLM